WGAQMRWLALVLALMVVAPAWGASTIDQLPPVPFPLIDPYTDPGDPTKSHENLWITRSIPGVSGPTDYRIPATPLGYIFQGSTAPTNPYVYQQWWDTSTTPSVLKIYSGSVWIGIASFNPTTGLWVPLSAGSGGNSVSDNAALQAQVISAFPS